MSSLGNSDRNLLFGILALQRGFIRERDLIAALHAWALVPQRALSELLLERRAMTPSQHDEVARLALARGESVLATGPVAAPLVALAPSRFRLEGLHASGGLGEVYIAHDNELDRKVALKQIRDRWADDPACRARFLREARLTARLEHPGVVPILGMGAYPDGRPFYAMRLIHGETFRDAIRRHHAEGETGPGLRELLDRFVSVCQTMAYAHARGVIHRDLKPANVLLGAYGETLVVDWGLARLLDEADESLCLAAGGPALTVRGTPLGTPAYMSPEQASGRLDAVDARTDVYQLGGVLYETLTGQPPHPDGNPGRSPCLPRLLVATAPEALEALALRALAPAREDRPGGAAELAEAVQRWLASGDGGASTWRGLATPMALPADLGETSDVLLGACVEEDRSRGPDWPAESEAGYEATPSRYTLWQELARGGSGQLYLCHDEDLNRLVVIKELRRDLAANPHARRWFLREAQITAQLEHPGIRGVHAVGTHPDGRPFLVLRYVRGRDLRQAVREFHERRAHPSANDPQLCSLVRALAQVARSLAFAHERGVVHGDPKPGNILLGSTGEVLLSDWGLARLLPAARQGRVTLSEWAEPETSPNGEALGTPEYMAPEAALGEAERIGPATDVFALGATLFHLLAGQPVWGETAERDQTLARARTGTAPPVRELAPWVPVALAATTERALAREPDRRHADASELARELERWAASARSDRRT